MMKTFRAAVGMFFLNRTQHWTCSVGRQCPHTNVSRFLYVKCLQNAIVRVCIELLLIRLIAKRISVRVVAMSV